MMKFGRASGFTLVELVVSVGLLIVALSIALFATVGSSSLIAKTDSRSAVAEGARTLSDTVRRTAQNAPVGAVNLLGTPNADGTFPAIRVKSYSGDQATTACYVVGRAVATEVNGEERYTLDSNGSVAALWVYGVDNAGLCPLTSSPPLYQNRLNDRQTKLTELRAYITSFPCLVQTATCFSKQQLRVWGTIEQLRKIGVGTVAESRKPSLSFETSIAIGLVNQSQQALSIETTALNSGLVGTAYNDIITATGGTPSYTFTLNSGTLPAGLSLATNGAITGTPTTQGTSNFVAKVTDSNAVIATRSLSITINPAASAVSITTVSPLSPAATELTPYSFQFAATGGSGSFSWALESGAPAWLIISSGGLLSGTPPDGSNPSVSFSVRATDSVNPTNFAIKAITLPINDNVAQPPLTITTASPLSPNATEQTAYSYQFQASGGSGGYTWAFDGPIPMWLAISSSGLLTGTPPSGSAPQVVFTVRVTDSSMATITKSITLPILGGVGDPGDPGGAG